MDTEPLEAVEKLDLPFPYGVKVPHSTLASPAYHSQVKGEKGYVTEAPEICVEIMSPSNSGQEMAGKIPRYFEGGCPGRLDRGYRRKPLVFRAGQRTPGAEPADTRGSGQYLIGPPVTAKYRGKFDFRPPHCSFARRNW